jgi:hypothetical protein
MIGCGVPAGAIKPNQPEDSALASPTSASVGTFGRLGERRAPVMAIARTLPASILGTMPGIGPR